MKNYGLRFPSPFVSLAVAGRSPAMMLTLLILLPLANYQNMPGVVFGVSLDKIDESNAAKCLNSAREWGAV
jgi:hypothetical protein